MADSGMTEVGKYRIIGQIGEGAMGVVYRALDPVLNRAVAIKVMSDALARDEDLRGRFLREAQAAGSLQHPNVVTIYDFGEVEGHLYIAMEFVVGHDLEDVLLKQRPLTVPQKIDILIDVLSGLAYAHKRGIVHRDIKPANIRIDEDGRARIMDFGIAHLTSSKMTKTGIMVGTPAYMAPEQIVGGPIVPGTDLFSVGAVMYELFTGNKPFAAESLQSVFYKIVTAPAPSMSSDAPALPAALDMIVQKALAKDASDRYASALDMANALAAAKSGMDSTAGQSRSVSLRSEIATGLAVPRIVLAAPDPALASPDPALAAPVAAPSRRGRTAAIVGGAVAVIAAAAVILLPHRTHADPPAIAPPAAPAPPAASAASPVIPSPGEPAAATPPSAPRVVSAGSAAANRAPASKTPVKTPAKAAAASNARVLDTVRPVQPTAPGAPVQPKPKTDVPVIAPLPAPVISAPVAAPPPPGRAVVDPSAEIAAVLAAYARAIDSRDVNEVKRAYPGATPAQASGFEQFFSSVRSLHATFAMSSLDVQNATAEGRVIGSYDYITASGKSEKQPLDFQASFRRDGSAWKLVAVRANH